MNTLLKGMGIDVSTPLLNEKATKIGIEEQFDEIKKNWEEQTK